MGRLVCDRESEGKFTSMQNPSICADNAGRIVQRNASSLSTASSEFEFDSGSFAELQDGGPLSPKLLYSPNHTLNYPLNGEIALHPPTNHFFADTDHTHVHNLQHDYLNYGAASLKQKINGEISSSRDANHEKIGSPSKLARGESGSEQIKGAVINDDKHGLRAQSDHKSVDNHAGNGDYEDPGSAERANHDANQGQKTTNLASLLRRRDWEQLPPLTNYSDYQYKKDIKKQVPGLVSSSASASPAASPLNYYANYSPNSDDHLDYAGEASPPESKSSHKKSRKWSFKLDFLKKSSNSKAEQKFNQSGSHIKQCNYSPNHRTVISDNPDRCSYDAAADEAGFFDEGRDTAAAVAAGEAGIVDSNQLNQRIDHYRTAAAAGEARFNRMINPSINVNQRAAADQAARESRLNQQINQSIDNYRFAAAAAITRFESPRHSTCSAISSVSSSPRHAEINEVIRANQRKISRSAPMSPVGSPPRSSPHAAGGAGDGAFTRGRAPMSPHAVHYQKQRARSEELRRKTFLPYRQSLLGACFFPLSTPHTHHHHPQQAVY